jgi:GNAT superfamily N-acetyltransferase
MIRLMTPQDIPGAMQLKEAAGWSQSSEDWARLLELEPEGCFVDERDGIVAGTTTALCYDSDLAWIGMVLVAPEYRRQGIARGLMEFALDWLQQKRVRCVKLDATDQGRPLYLDLGFIDECAIERWARDPAGEPTLGGFENAAPGLSQLEDETLDRAAVGVVRNHVISSLLEAEDGDCFSTPDGFLLGRKGSAARFLGPCVAAGESSAAGLISTFLARHSAEPVFWDLLPANVSARRLASSFGFESRRRLMRMVLEGGESTLSIEHPEYVYATAGFEFG